MSEKKREALRPLLLAIPALLAAVAAALWLVPPAAEWITAGLKMAVIP